MKGVIEKRTLHEADLFLSSYSATIRSVAEHFDLSVSTVHKDLTMRLSYLDSDLYYQVIEKLAYNKSVRNIRGGVALSVKRQSVS